MSKDRKKRKIKFFSEPEKMRLSEEGEGEERQRRRGDEDGGTHDTSIEYQMCMEIAYSNLVLLRMTAKGNKFE